MHTADLSSPHQSIAQTDEAGAGKTTENIVTPQDKSRASPVKSPSQQEAPVSQGKVVFLFKAFYSHQKMLLLLVMMI